MENSNAPEPSKNEWNLLFQLLFKAYKFYNVKPEIPNPFDNGIHTYESLACGLAIDAIGKDLIKKEEVGNNND